MTEISLICNQAECQVELTQTAFVTNCYHIFCEEHGSSLLSATKCFTCLTNLNSKFDVIKINLNPDERAKNLLMAGYRPELIMDICTRALTFWTSQVLEQMKLMELSIQKANENSQMTYKYCNRLYSRYNLDVATLQQKCNDLEEKLQKANAKCEQLVKQLTDKTKALNEIEIERIKGRSPINLPRAIMPISGPKNLNQSEPENVSVQMESTRLPDFVQRINPSENQNFVPERVPSIHPFQRPSFNPTNIGFQFRPN